MYERDNGYTSQRIKELCEQMLSKDMSDSNVFQGKTLKDLVDSGWNIEDGYGTYRDINDNKKESGNPLWYQDGDCIKTDLGTNIILQKTVSLVKGTYTVAKIWKESDPGDFYYSLDGVDFHVLNNGQSFTLNEDKSVVFQLRGNGNPGRIGAFELKDENNDINTLLGSTTFYDDGWKALEESVHYDNNIAFTGNLSIWERNGDDAIEHTGSVSSIAKVYDASDFEEMRLSFSQGYSYNAYIDVYGIDNNGYSTLIKRYNTKDAPGDNGKEAAVREQFDDILNVKDYQTIKIAISSQTTDKARVAILDIEPIQYKLGDYHQSKTKFDQLDKEGKIITVDDFETCMDYTYYMLNHLFDKNNYLANPHYKGTYDTLYLERINTDSGIAYQFDSAKETHYNKNTIYNYGEGDSQGFFPLDDVTHDDQSVNELEHNFHFTLHCDGMFEYYKSNNYFFDFSGDDDVYLYMNNALVLDLGGAHLPASGKVYVNDLIEQGIIKNEDGTAIEEGDIISFDFFYMERHSTASNLKVNTNIPVERKVDDPEYRKVIVEWDDFNDKYGLCPEVVSLLVFIKENGEWVRYSNAAYPLYKNGSNQHTYALPKGKEYQFRIYGIPDVYQSDGNLGERYFVINEDKNTVDDKYASIHRIVNKININQLDKGTVHVVLNEENLKLEENDKIDFTLTGPNRFKTTGSLTSQDKEISYTDLVVGEYTLTTSDEQFDVTVTDSDENNDAGLVDLAENGDETIVVSPYKKKTIKVTEGKDLPPQPDQDKKPVQTKVETGDSTEIVIYVAVSIIAVAGILIFVMKRKNSSQ